MSVDSRRIVGSVVVCALCLALVGCGPSAKQRVDSIADRVLSEHYRHGGDTTAGDEETQALREIGADAIPPLIDLLQHEDEWTRRFAASALGELRSPEPEVLPAIIEALDDESFYVRWSAALAIGQTPGPVSVRAPAAAKMLGDDSLTAQSNGLKSLVAMDVGALDEVMPVVVDLDAKARRRFLSTLGSFPDPTARKLAVLRSFLDDPDADVRVAAIRTAAGIEAPYEMVAAVLVVGLADEYPSVREEAVCGYMAVGAPHDELAAVLLLALDQPDAAFRGEIVQALAAMGRPVLPELIATLSHSEARMRIGALGVLRDFDEPFGEAVPDLIRLLGDDQGAARRRAEAALRRDGSVVALAAVARHHIGLLRRAKGDIRLGNPSVIALASVGGPAVPPLISALDESDDPMLRRGAAFALGSIGPREREAAPKLLGMLSNDDASQAREAAAYALGRIGADPAEAVPALIAAFDDGSLTVRNAAVDSLVLIGEPGFSDLVDTLRVGSPDAKACATRALAAIGGVAVRALAHEIATYGPR